MNDLTLVNLHLTLLPLVGENTVKNHSGNKLSAFALTLQETLKGKIVFPQCRAALLKLMKIAHSDFHFDF